MILIDTHTHLYSEEFENDRTEMMERALAAGVKHFFVPAIDASYFNGMQQIQQQYPQNVHLMMGLHPCYVKPETFEEELAFVEQELAKGTYVAVGEIGVDLYWDQSTLKIQQQAFQTQIQWAKKLGLPINIHCRDAFDAVFEVLDQEKSNDLFGIFHCFTGDFKQAERALNLNMKLGIGGVATFKNGKIDQYLNQIPLEHIVLETDSPYLAPAPYRGKRNESSYVALVAQKLAAIYNLSVEEIANQTTKNALNIFKL
ncbi:TatD family hydrolase [Flavobacterium sp. CBA20B-1]|uniref:TatD family hydrolase n=1 Tax=unclassified Flavobacterium TaxID=196869 RepID=UPI002224B2E4|nr:MULTISPECIES: TatD family hydrolase [unclassified Flavobacterium]WCM41328.1 TatD family hydrolase [Flavobacterium sp. CBA20B-1]